MKISTSIIFSILFISSSYFLQAQTTSDSLKNHSSLENKVYENHISYQKTVWRRISLKEKQNRPFFATDNEITKHIIDAVKRGVITPYKNDSLQLELWV